jgi:hypothetical protein
MIEKRWKCRCFFSGVIRKYDNVFLSRLRMIDSRSDAGPMKYRIKEPMLMQQRIILIHHE